MKKSKFTEEQIVFVLKQAGVSTEIPEIRRQLGISQSKFYAWRERYGSLGVAIARRVEKLEAENIRLNQIVADLSLDKEMLQEVVRNAL
jgi:putative transposase